MHPELRSEKLTDGFGILKHATAFRTAAQLSDWSVEFVERGTFLFEAPGGAILDGDE